MKTRDAFGRTWWGASWLRALADIDDENRLPRGRSYANRGAVTEMVVAGNQIRALVQGSRRRPYRVTVVVPPMTPADADRLARHLAGNPARMARLLNRDLDPAVLDVATSLGIVLFPARWSDLQMHCDCPDGAVPCKHLAAVIYLLSREIDGDPFQVFRLRNVDLGKLLDQHGIAISPTAIDAVPTTWLALHGERPGADGDGGGRPLDFTTLPDLRDALWSLLSEQPTFWQRGDFREYSRRHLARLALAARDALDRPAVLARAPAAPPALPAGRLRFAFEDPDLLVPTGVTVEGKPVESLARLLTVIEALPPARLADLPPAFARLDTLRLLALHLLANGAVVPRVYAGERSMVGLMWTAAEVDPTVLGMIGQQAGEWPADFVAQRQGRRLVALAAGVQVRLLLSAVIDTLLRRHARETGIAELDGAPTGGSDWPGTVVEESVGGSKDAPERSDAAGRRGAANRAGRPIRGRGADRTSSLTRSDARVHELFYGTGSAALDAPGEGAIIGGIQTWLSRLQLGAQPFRPVLSLDEIRSGNGNGAEEGGALDSAALDSGAMDSDDGSNRAVFSLALAIVDEAADFEAPTPLARVLSDPVWSARQPAVLRTVVQLASFLPSLHDYVNDGARRPLTVPAVELPSLLADTLPAMRLLGVQVVLPRALQRLLRPRLSMQIRAARDQVGSGLDTASVLSFNWMVALGDERITAAEFKRLLGKAEGIVRFRGQYVWLQADEVRALKEGLAHPPALAGADLLRIALAEDYDGAPVSLDRRAQALLARLREQAEVALPAGLTATLRPYQQRGYDWLWRNARLGLGSVIADDMGLGKTLQVLTLIQRLKEDGDLAHGGALVIVPTSLLTNWQKEAARFTPGLSVEVLHGARRQVAGAASGQGDADRQPPDLVLTTYGVVRKDADRLATMRWRLLIIDEAQNIKNPAAGQTRAVKSIGAVSRIAMSGTPVENRLSEYWSIIDFAQHGHLGGLTRFTRDFATPIQVHRDRQAADRLRRVLAPFVLRRLKTDKTIIDDLPDKLEQDQHCLLSPRQAALYESVVREGLRTIRGESDAFTRQGLVLQMILALKQVCNHPVQFLKQGEADPSASGKVQRLFDLLDEIDAAGHKVLVFTQFREMGELLVRMLASRQTDGEPAGRAPLFLHGGLSRARRDDMVSAFQDDPGQRILLLSLKAGGTGLNLTAASQVIHFDLWWNPAVEAQATDRAYRIGQRRDVQVHRLITRGSFEERINEMIRNKRDLADMTVGVGESWIGKLPPAELAALFRLDRRPA